MDGGGFDVKYLARFLGESEEVVKQLGGLDLSRAVRMRIELNARDGRRLPQTPQASGAALPEAQGAAFPLGRTLTLVK
jgi:hypothetical protein